MNWPFVLRCAMFGFLWGLWQAGSSIYVLPSMPDGFTWLKIAAASVVAFVGGCLTYSRDPEAALKLTPGGK
jgi:hypothetical protein